MAKFNPREECNQCPFIRGEDGEMAECRFPYPMSFIAKAQKFCQPCLMGMIIEEIQMMGYIEDEDEDFTFSPEEEESVDVTTY